MKMLSKHGMRRQPAGVQNEPMKATTDTVARLRAADHIAPANTNPAPWPVTKARYTPAQVDALFAESRCVR